MQVTLVGPRWVNAPHGAEIGIHNALDNLGYKTQILDPRQRNDISYKEILDFNPDFVLVPGCTPGYDFLVDLAAEKSIPIVNWNSEEIRLSEYKERVERFGKLYNHIFHFDVTALSLYKNMGFVNVSALMQGFDPNRHFNIDVPREPVVQFIGSLGGKHENRLYLINYLKKNGIPIRVVTCHDPLKNSHSYSSAAVSLNLGLHTGEFPIDSFRAYAFQQRIFESFGSNTPVLTHEPEGLNKWACHLLGLNDNVNVLFYNRDNLIDRVKFALDPKHTEVLVGHTKAYKSMHTYAARLSQMIEVLKEREIIK